MIADATNRAREYLANSLNTEQGDDIDEFVELHLEELEPAYWEQHLGTPNPSPLEIIAMLVSKKPVDWDDLAMVDFGLPGDVSQYVLSVRITETSLKSISMES